MEGLSSETCPICLGKFKDAHLLHGCGHLFCRRCLARTLRAGRDDFVCPICRSEPAEYIPRPLRLVRIATPVVALRPAFPPTPGPSVPTPEAPPCGVALHPSDNGTVSVAIAIRGPRSVRTGRAHHIREPSRSCSVPHWIMMLLAGMLSVVVKQMAGAVVAFALWQATRDTVSWMEADLLWCAPSDEALGDCKGLGDDITENMRYGGSVSPSHVLRSLQAAAIIYGVFQAFGIWIEIRILKASIVTHRRGRRAALRGILEVEDDDSPRHNCVLKLCDFLFPAMGETHEEMSDGWCYRTWLASCMSIHGMLGIFHVPMITRLRSDPTSGEPICVEPLGEDFCPYSANWFNDLKDFRLFVLLGLAGWVVLLILTASSACSHVHPNRRMSRTERDQMVNLSALIAMAPVLWVSAILLLYGIMGAWTTFIARPSMLLLLAHTAGTLVISRAIMYNDDVGDWDILSSNPSSPRAVLHPYSPLA